MEDKSVNSPMNVMMRSVTGVDDNSKPTIKDVFSQMLYSMNDDEKAKAAKMLDSIDTAVRAKNINLKRTK